MFHEGQFEGRKVRVPVFPARRPEEALDTELRSFYRKLLAAINSPVFRDGQWSLCERTGWPDNQSCQDIVAWLWRKDNERYLIVVNLSDAGAQAEVKIGWDDIADKTWRLADLLSGAEFER
jgi:hypothetical protein